MPLFVDFLPSTRYDAMMKVVVIALPQIAPFELGVVCEVFGTDRTADGFPAYEFDVVTPDGKPIMTKSAFQIVPTGDLSLVGHADLVAVPAHPIGTQAPEAVLAALRAANARGAYVLSVCSGAFLLGEAGLLDGRRCTTHWQYAAELARRFPLADVAPDALYVEDDGVLTSAGTAAGIDACLHLVRKLHGSAIATALARRMVVPPHRDGGQTQFVDTPMPTVTCDSNSLTHLLSWLVEHLDEPITVDDLAARTHMAPRTFARRFRAEVGTTPHEWLTSQRVLLARRLLEETDLAIESVAAHSGFGDAATLRHHFGRRLGATPQGYRTRFRTREPVA
jgi:AraC family transcriptional regulator, transcriptional activator FtrA